MFFRDKVCVITGASSGIGFRTARDLASDGARVVAVARREDRLRDLVDSMAGSGHSYLVTDVSDRAAVDRLADFLREEYGRVDLLVNNAGLSSPAPFTDEDAVSVTRTVMDVNFFGAVHCTKALLPLLMEAAPSSVVNVASMAGRLAMGGAASYCASKFALVGWSESLHFELSEVGVWVSLVEPGPLPTEGFPQRGLKDDRYLKHVLTDDATVSEAIRKVAQDHRLQRVVPRWFYLLQIPRLIAPPAYRMAQERLVKARVKAERRSR